MKFEGTQNRILEYGKNGEVKLLRKKAADQPEVTALSEEALVKTLRHAVDCGLDGRDRGIAFSYTETEVLVSKKTFNDIMDGVMNTPYSSFSDLKVFNRQAAYFWERKGLLKDYENGSGDDFPTCAVLEDNPHAPTGFERVKEGGIFDTRDPVTGEGRWPYKTRGPKACKWAVCLDTLLPTFFERQIFASTRGIDGLREMWNMAYWVSRPGSVGKQVFFKLSPTCDLNTEATEFITLEEPQNPTIKVLNPHRGQKQGALRTREPIHTGRG